jgi:hypothetical protein
MRTNSRSKAELAVTHALALAALLATSALGPAAEAAAQGGAPAPTPEGLWQGPILYDSGRAEVDVIVELAPATDGRWAGTIDIPTHGLQFHPLDEIAVEGAKVSFLFVRQSPAAGRVESPFEGELSTDGATLRGTFTEGRKNPFPLVLERIGEAGDPRPEPRFSEVHPLSPDAEELRAAFNRDEEAVRVVMLLSPT